MFLSFAGRTLLLPRHRDLQPFLRGDQVVGILGVFA
jgi:hypothetical protein